MKKTEQPATVAEILARMLGTLRRLPPVTRAAFMEAWELETEDPAERWMAPPVPANTEDEES